MYYSFIRAPASKMDVVEDSCVKENLEVKEAAKVMSKLGASKGGKARAEALSPEERREIARQAVMTRWARHKKSDAAELPRETHTGILQIGDREIPCSVLDNGLRVLSSSGLSRVMGSRRKGRDIRLEDREDPSPKLPPFLYAANVKPFISDDLMAPLISPIRYKMKSSGIALGYEATLIPRICEVILDANKAGVLKANQQYIVETAEILMRGFARVGIIALVDEATGYQAERDRNELHKILAAYISEELLPWAKRFPNEFYQHMFRLKGWPYSPITGKRPREAGKITNKIVYEKLPPGILDELRRKNPVGNNWQRQYKHHQFLTEDIGHPHLQKHLVAVTTLMRASKTWKQFDELLENAFPSTNDGQQIEIELEQEWSCGMTRMINPKEREQSSEQ
jgi:hypothetical protein